MTSKKCLVMNLKLGRSRPSNPNLLDKSQNRSIKRSNISPINNNLTTSPNHNNYLPILPKYSEAAAAFLQSSSIPPFYLAPPNLPITPYSMPTLGHIFEQLQQQNPSPLRPPILDTINPEDYNSLQTQIKQEEDEQIKSNTSSCGELIMDEEIEEKEETAPPPNGDLEAVKRILETVNATVTKQLLQANITKFSSDSSRDSSVHSPKQISCTNENECDQKSEGLAAKLEDIVSVKEEEEDCESVTTTDHVSEDGRKVRVRSLISDEQLKVLKDHYKLNPRPKREDLEKIAETIGFPVRVVQVWFQNTRARDRREGRLIQVPYSPALRYPLVPSSNKLQTLPYSEQPLDLSTKRGPPSIDSSPRSSPHPEILIDEAVNLSQRSPSPIDFNNSSRLAQILAQPKLSMGMGLVPMEQLMGLSGDLPSLSQLITNRLSLSPNSKKLYDGDDEEKRKFVLKSLGSPGNGEQEIEGQFSCDQCDKAFSKQSSLARHKYEHSGKNERDFNQ